MKRVSLLGSTGSIGVSTLDVVAGQPDEFSVVALAAGRNVPLLAKQIERFRPALAAVIDEGHARELRRKLGAGNATEILFGDEGYREVARAAADTVVSAMVGAAGLLPTLEAIDAGRQIALANKETLVMAGHLVLRRARERGVELLPVDSEHSAIFQCLQGNRREEVRRIILTASGGPFLNTPKAELARVTPAQALRHPNWAMGQKITIDSATMMNKALEIIEAGWLFGLPGTGIDVLIHPQSIVHSLVEYRDGSVIAQMGVPDMRLPIAYALSYPKRMKRNDKPLDLAQTALTFLHPDHDRFPALGLAYTAIANGGTAPAVLNSANEEAVTAFIAGRIPFDRIVPLVAEVLAHHDRAPDPEIETILAADRWARDEARKRIEGIKN
jgi:1-deoxy-D-xylulose-5-phosphate reductoisomerase